MVVLNVKDALMATSTLNRACMNEVWVNTRLTIKNVTLFFSNVP